MSRTQNQISRDEAMPNVGDRVHRSCDVTKLGTVFKRNINAGWIWVTWDNGSSLSHAIVNYFRELQIVQETKPD